MKSGFLISKRVVLHVKNGFLIIRIHFLHVKNGFLISKIHFYRFLNKTKCLETKLAAKGMRHETGKIDFRQKNLQKHLEKQKRIPNFAVG